MIQSPEVSQALVQIAEQLGVAVEHLWAVAKSRPLYEAIQWVPWTVLWALIAASLWRAAPSITKKDDTAGAACYTLAFGVMVCAGMTIIGCVNNLAGLLNPDAYALDYILNNLRR